MGARKKEGILRMKKVIRSTLATAIMLLSITTLCLSCDRRPPGPAPTDHPGPERSPDPTEAGVPGDRLAYDGGDASTHRRRCPGPADHEGSDVGITPAYHPMEWMRHQIGDAYSVWLPVLANRDTVRPHRRARLDRWSRQLFPIAGCGSDTDAGEGYVAAFVAERARARGPKPQGPATIETHFADVVSSYPNGVEVHEWSGRCSAVSCTAIAAAMSDYGYHEAQYFVYSITGMP